MTTGTSTRIPLQLSRGRVVASLQVDLTDGVLIQFRRDLLEFVRSSGASGVILDVSGVAVMDVTDFEALRRIVATVSILGARTVIAGMRPGVVAALIELGIDDRGILAAPDLDGALELLERGAGPPPSDGGASRG